MNLEQLRTFCLSQKAVSEGMPFGDNTLVFKVFNKIFALASLDAVGRVNLKCDPELALELREQYPDEVTAGYHMNKKHWNTIKYDGTISDALIREFITHSYNLVVQSLPKKERDLLLNNTF